MVGVGEARVACRLKIAACVRIYVTLSTVCVKENVVREKTLPKG